MDCRWPGGNRRINCFYCDKIRGTESQYIGSEATHDLGSEAPRCDLHWRYTCGKCGEPAHFMSTAYDPDAERFFCSDCATEVDEVPDPFWAWKYFFRYRSPCSGYWSPGLDRLEFEGRHPLRQRNSTAVSRAVISREEYLVRYPERAAAWRTDAEVSDADIQSAWTAHAIELDSRYDEDGDRNRKYKSDEPMMHLLGEVKGKQVLDLGNGNGYLCRKLARAGAITTGVELSDGPFQIAMSREAEDKLGIAYYRGSIAAMDFLADASFDKAVSNYVLMDTRDYLTAIKETYRVLKPGGLFVTVISHPSFSSGPLSWVRPAPDSPRREDRSAYRVDNYFHRGPYYRKLSSKLDPFVSFHRPLRDYWEAFVKAGFKVDAFEEPSITERGRRELPVSIVDNDLRKPDSCIFRMVKPVE